VRFLQRFPCRFHWRFPRDELFAIAMRRLTAITATFVLSLASPAAAIVGGAAPSPEGIGRSVITIVGSRGNFCTGSVIAPALVLTAAHCVQPGADYKIVQYDADRKAELRDVKTIAIHPGFRMQEMLGHRATADVALLRLAVPAKGKTPARLSVPQPPLVPGNAFTVAGVGVTIRGDGKSAGIIRTAGLVATGKPGTLQIRLVDPAGQGTAAGLGACTGDSGAPVFEDQQGGQAIIGVVSWSTGANGSDGCGGLTGVTPLTLYRDWILQTSRQWGFSL
jgi:secreted trypsin-like serine protease